MKNFIVLTLLLLSTLGMNAQMLKKGESIQSGGCRLAGTEITITHTGSSLEVNISEYSGEAVVYITNGLGSVIDADWVTINEQGEIEKNIDAIEPGKYTIIIETENGILSESFIKE